MLEMWTKKQYLHGKEETSMRSSGYCHIPHYMLLLKDLSWSLEDAASAEATTGNAEFHYCHSFRSRINGCWFIHLTCQ